ncbi:MAG: xylulose kinase [Thermogemmatispora sp.]|jgi:xylulokinase|uniref:Sugar kinase n=1 Tax=Thermogemmatispora aurantia TaxID=2045279 RepID=A0A5J4K1D3_9CHLR|nr:MULTISPECIES: FGGY family carbohydrate kinase [Thermogemmatispora]MBE3566129.1 xylulose kinase [Thermogemmatispora sp.]GER82868.1 sugar kinase [Thermogemmatispora aurantia]
MGATTALLGIDLGTSAVKAVILDLEGRLLGEGRAEYALLTRRPGWAESIPADWWRATRLAVREARERAPQCQIAGVGLAGQMHGVVMVAADGQPTRAAMLWPDRRAEKVLARFRALPGALRQRLANPLVPGMAGPLLCWLAEHEPACYARSARALLPKDWLRLRLTARRSTTEVTSSLVTEASDASATLLYDLPADRWAEEVIAALGLRFDLLPPLLSSAAQAGTLSSEAAAALELPSGLPVATGAADVAAALLGAGVLAPGTLLLSLGTGAQLVLLCEEPQPDPTLRTHLYRAADGRHWYRMAAVQNAGLVLDWLRRQLHAEWSEVYASLEQVPPGAEGLTFLPTLTPERPHYNGPQTGAFVGLRLEHSRAHLLRAALEGVACGIRLALERLPGAGEVGSLLVAGGGSLHPAWRQLLADLLGRPLLSLEAAETTARGAALLGGLAAGVWSEGQELARLAPARSVVTTPGEQQARCAALYARYLELLARGRETGTPVGP